jgi:hypothetical protein
MRDEARLASYAEIVARLARPLADRDAVLWLARLDEAAFARLERLCLTMLAEDADAAAVFGRAFARATALLDDTEEVAAPTAVAPSHVEPSHVEPDTHDLAVETDTLPLSPPTKVDTTHTLASTTQAMAPRTPKSR